MNEILFATEMPKPKQKFVAFYHDGSGCDMFVCIKQGVFLNPNGEEYTEENMESYLFWIPISTDYEFWFEQWVQ